jgi:beta-exotoxin I transport system ATP-binding protein
MDDRDLVIQTGALAKRFGRVLALDGLSLDVRAGEVLGFLGPNGAGKTTTLRLLMGYLRPTAGSARVLGLDSWRDSVAIHARTGPGILTRSEWVPRRTLAFGTPTSWLSRRAC